MRVISISGWSTSTVMKSARQRLSTARLMLEWKRERVRKMVDTTRLLQTRPRTKVHAPSTETTAVVPSPTRTTLTLFGADVVFYAPES